MLLTDGKCDVGSNTVLSPNFAPIQPLLLLLLLLLVLFDRAYLVASNTGVGDWLRQTEHRFSNEQNATRQLDAIWPDPNQHQLVYKRGRRQGYKWI